MELYVPFQFNFIGNQERTTNIQDSLKQLEHLFDTVFKFELSNKNVILQAKNNEIDFQLKTYFKSIPHLI